MAGISIHAPREGGDRVPAFGVADIRISIHAPREGGDWQSAETPDSINIFQSTPPARGATMHHTSLLLQICISIHAPREGGDPSWERQYRAITAISIHAPREGGDDI